MVTGNTVVVKPSPYTPLSTAMLSEMAAEAFPPGVLRIAISMPTWLEFSIENAEMMWNCP